MFWIILLIIFLTITMLGFFKSLRTTEDFNAVFAIISVVCLVIIIVQGGMGITDYPDLKKRYASIQALEHRIKDIKEATYTHKQNGNFVAGSIENMSQSTNLSNFIIEVAKREADYNEYLQCCKTYKEEFVLFLFGNGWAISNKIYDLPETPFPD